MKSRRNLAQWLSIKSPSALQIDPNLTFSDSSRTSNQVRGVENPGSELGFWNLGFGNLGSWPGLRTWVLNSWVFNLGITPGFWNPGIQNLGELPGLITWVWKPGLITWVENPGIKNLGELPGLITWVLEPRYAQPGWITWVQNLGSPPSQVYDLGEIPG